MSRRPAPARQMLKLVCFLFLSIHIFFVFPHNQYHKHQYSNHIVTSFFFTSSNCCFQATALTILWHLIEAPSTANVTSQKASTWKKSEYFIICFKYFTKSLEYNMIHLFFLSFFAPSHYRNLKSELRTLFHLYFNLQQLIKYAEQVGLMVVPPEK